MTPKTAGIEGDKVVENTEILVAFLKAMADKTRVRVLGLLAEREYTVKELASALALKEPTLSAHLNVLKAVGLVAMRPQGTAHYYRLRQDDIHALLRDIKAAALDDMGEEEGESERQVLQRFFAHGRLTEIPTRHGKMLIVLRHLAREFTFGLTYPEKQVNAILLRFHPDCATLRRQMVDNGLMARKNSVYWRLEPVSPPVLAGE